MAVYVGTTKRITASFRNIAGTLANPTSVVLTVLAPDGTTTTPTPVNDSAGVYHYDVTLDQAGVWRWGWDGDGTIDVASQGDVYVARSAVLA